MKTNFISHLHVSMEYQIPSTSTENFVKQFMQKLFPAHHCDLKLRSKSLRLISKEKFSTIYHQTKVEPNPFTDIWTHANAKSPLIQSAKQQGFFFFPLLHKSFSKVDSRSSSWIASISYIISSQSVEKYVRKFKQQVLLSADLVTPSQGKGHRKWYGTYKHGMYEKNLVDYFAYIAWC